jgi:hypothetical protein
MLIIGPPNIGKYRTHGERSPRNNHIPVKQKEPFFTSANTPHKNWIVVTVVVTF